MKYESEGDRVAELCSGGITGGFSPDRIGLVVLLLLLLLLFCFGNIAGPCVGESGALGTRFLSSFYVGFYFVCVALFLCGEHHVVD